MNSLKKRVIIGTTSVFVLLYVLLFVSIDYEVKKTTLPLNKALMQQLIDSKSIEINDWFKARVSEISTLAEFSSRYSLTRKEIFQETRDLESRQENVYESIRLVTTDGISKSWIAPDFSIIDRQYFQALKTNHEEYIVSNVVHSKEANQDIIILLYRLPKPTADNIGYIAAAVPVATMNKIAAEIRVYDGVGTLATKHDTDQIKKEKNEVILQGTIDLLPKWKLIYSVQKNELLGNGRKILQMIVLIGSFFIVIFTAFVVFLMDSFVHPIEKLRDTMIQVRQGNRTIRAEIIRSDEVGELSEQFNHMLNKIYESEKDSRKAAIRLLQEQVKPHFLYNTFDTIQWLASAGEIEKVNKMVISLSQYFRVGLNNGSEWTTIENEIQHVDSYLTIQEIRYEKHIEILYDIEDGIENYQIPHFILQPLVENALYHGIRPLKEKNKQIKITAELDKNNMIFVEVSNTGRLPSEQKIESINQFLQNDFHSAEGMGFGLYSIAYRLKLSYGEDWSMETKIDKDRFIVELRMKIKEERDEH